jgi:hypothetical protein
MPELSYLKSIQDLRPLFEGADYVDVKTQDAAIDLRRFLAGLISYQPWWIDLLYRVRAGFVRLLGMRQESVPHMEITPDSISFVPGDQYGFFAVTHGQDGEYLAAGITDKHLKADILVAREWLGDGVNRFHVATVVNHRHWTGPVYFSVVRPFHHLVVRQMMRAAARG